MLSVVTYEICKKSFHASYVTFYENCLGIELTEAMPRVRKCRFYNQEGEKRFCRARALDYNFPKQRA